MKGFSALAAGLALAPLAVLVPAESASTTYTFEKCAEGWKVRSASPDPYPLSNWHRSQPGSSSDQALWSGPPYTHNAFDTVTSLAHSWAGGSVTVRFDVLYHFEPEQTSLGADNVTIQWSRDAINWLPLKKYKPINSNFPRFNTESVSFTAPLGKVYLRFLLQSDDLIEGVGAAVDNVVVPFARPTAARC